MHATPPEDRAPRPSARLAVQAVFDRMAGRVEIGGQLLDAHDSPIVGADVVIRSSWGMECSTVSTALGSFGARMSAPADTRCLEIAIEAAGIAETVNVR